MLSEAPFPTAAVVGGVLAASLVIATIVVIVYCHLKRRGNSGQENKDNTTDNIENTSPQTSGMISYQGLVLEEGAYENDTNDIDNQDVPHEYDEIKENNYYNVLGGNNDTNPYEDINAYENAVIQS